MLVNFRDTGKMDGGRSGFVTILDKENNAFPIRATKAEYKNGALQPLFMDGNIFYHGHDVCVDEEKNIMYASGMQIKRIRLN